MRVGEADNSIIAALRHQLATQQARHHAEITELRTLLRQRETELAAVHGELHRLTTQRPPTTS